MEIRVRNVHQGLPLGINLLMLDGMKRDSRNGEVMVMQESVRTIFANPLERVLFYRERDANPFFHFFESLWMLAGRNDVGFVTRFVSTMADFSDDGKTFNGAYGFRWREHFTVPTEDLPYAAQTAPIDQLRIIGERLAKDHTDRRSVLAMWDGFTDLGKDSKDIPCNLNAKFNVRADGRLHMEVDNRSNDIIWGLYGANAVHFSYLLEYMAARVGVPVGTQAHNSFNYHGYLKTLLPLARLEETKSPYETGDVEPYPLLSNGATIQEWDKDLELFFMATEKDGDVRPEDFLTAFFGDVVMPLWHAHRAFKTLKGAARFEQALELTGWCKASDWSWACKDWLEQRQRAWERRADAGVPHE